MFDGTPLTRHWLIPASKRPKYYMPHPTMSPEEVRPRTQAVWDRFYSLPVVWKRSRCVASIKGRLAFVLISKLYRQMYANTGHRQPTAPAQSRARALGAAHLEAVPEAVRRPADAGAAGADRIDGYDRVRTGYAAGT